MPDTDAKPVICCPYCGCSDAFELFTKPDRIAIICGKCRAFAPHAHPLWDEVAVLQEKQRKDKS